MNKLIIRTSLILTLTIMFNNLEAQRITYNDLKFILYHNLGDSEDFLSKMGLSFSRVDTMGTKPTALVYNFAKNSPHSVYYFNIEKKSINDVFCSVSFFTVIQSDYLKLKESIKNLGFKRTGTEVYDGKLYITYRKGDLQIEFASAKGQLVDETTYYISLLDLKLNKMARSL